MEAVPEPIHSGASRTCLVRTRLSSSKLGQPFLWGLHPGLQVGRVSFRQDGLGALKSRVAGAFGLTAPFDLIGPEGRLSTDEDRGTERDEGEAGRGRQGKQ